MPTPRPTLFFRRAGLPLLGVAAAFGLAGCAGGLTVQDFAAQPPAFVPEQFFAGRVHTWGVLEDGDGNPKEVVTSVSQGRLQGNAVTIDQTISKADGTRQHRTWALTRVDAHRYTVSGSDVVPGSSTATLYGNTLTMEYDVVQNATLPLVGKTDVGVHLRHWLYLQDDGKTLISRTFVSKLGLTLARVAEYEHHDGP